MQEKKLDLKTSIRYLKGVGPKKAELLKKIGINTIEDLVYYLPRRHEDRGNFALVKNLKIGEYRAVRGKVLKIGGRFTKKGKNVFHVTFGDDTGIIYLVWFNQPFLRKFFKEGQELVVYGKLEKYDKLQMNHPEYEVPKDIGKSVNIGRIVPVYSLTEDVTQRYLRFLINEAFNNLVSLKEILPTNIRARRGLVDISFSIRNIHFPVSFENLSRAYKRIVFEEFFILQLALALKKKSIKIDSSGISHAVDEDLIDSFKALFPFELTASQIKTIDEIRRDMQDAKPMNRLLEGDVGSGKTVVAMYAILLSVQNGYQAAIMAPTEILARQHYVSISEALMPLGINVRLLVSGLPRDKKAEIQKEISDGIAQVVIGTHSLIWEGVAFLKLGLVVIDEQHKFGVNQRQLLRTKGRVPDVLVMTATPIPRTLALTVYGDLDISVIKELPKGRRPITTYSVEESSREMIHIFLREEVKKGRQAYIVYPKIEKGSNLEVKSALTMYNKFKVEVFPDLCVGLIHGRMGTKEKEDAMKKFKNKKIDILVSTTVVEVGIDVPNASVMVVENAERFGLSQLHQLRGRIGRGEHESYCILLGNPVTEEAKRRFFTMSETQDGFKVAEEDLELRGPGEFFGTKQHGIPELRFGNIIKDFEIMEEARSEAFKLIAEDPDLKNPRNSPLKKALKKRFLGKLELVKVG